MKKSLWMAAFVAAALSSCTQNEEIGNAVDSNNDAIKFSTYVGQNTRAAITNIESLKAEGEANGFYVLAYSTGASEWDAEAADPTLNFMLNNQVYWDAEATPSAIWTYDNIKYWPNEVDGVANNYGKVSFFAYAPEEITSVLAATPTTGAGFPTLTYTCPTDPAAQKDVVTAQTLNQTKVSNSGKVALIFNHILSKIGFSAKLAAEYENATITVTGLDVLYDATMAKTNTYRMDKETWGDATAEFGEGDEGVVLAGASKPLTWGVTTAGTADVISLVNTTNNNYLMMLPQEVATDAFKVRLTYTVKDDARTDAGAALITNVVTVPLPTITWVKGKQYTYVLKVSETAVKFEDITVSAWENYDSDNTNTGNVEVN